MPEAISITESNAIERAILDAEMRQSPTVEIPTRLAREILLSYSRQQPSESPEIKKLRDSLDDAMSAINQAESALRSAQRIAEAA